MVMFALMLTVLVGFTSLAVEVGRWYLAKAELSKAVDAAALAAANNISNPYVSVPTLAVDFGKENFSYGYLGTPGQGKTGAVNFVVTQPKVNQFKVTGTVSVFPIFSALFGTQNTALGSSGTAQKNQVQIMMILDRSGSMSGTPIADLRSGALSFLSFFDDTQTEDEMGLITYNQFASVGTPLQHNFVSPMTTQINALTATGTTNIEDALDQADGPLGFPDQTGLPGDQRVQQFIVFFTDGQANKFRGTFSTSTYNGGNPFDAVPFTDGTLLNPKNGSTLSGVSALPTGDGKPIGTTSCGGGQLRTTRWHVFSSHHLFPGYPVPGYSAEYCGIPQSALSTWWISTAKNMAIDHAQELRNKGIHIYTIGLGGVDRTFLGQVASGPEYEYYAPTPAQLEALFNAVAKEIKLRLVE